MEYTPMQAARQWVKASFPLGFASSQSSRAKVRVCVSQPGAKVAGTDSILIDH
jgi:hypothetical protein